MSLAFASTCVFSYVIDCCPKLNEEAFVAINTRNLLTFGLTHFVNDWLVKDGPVVGFFGLEGAVRICLLFDRAALVSLQCLVIDVMLMLDPAGNLC